MGSEYHQIVYGALPATIRAEKDAGRATVVEITETEAGMSIDELVAARARMENSGAYCGA